MAHDPSQPSSPKPGPLGDGFTTHGPPQGSDQDQVASPQDVTRLLAQAQSGETGAVEQLLPLVYTELRSLARSIFRDQRQSHTLQPTALVHEAFLKMTGKLEGVEGRKHFFLIAGRAMRQILTDHARAKKATKRGGKGHQVTLTPDMAATPEPAVDLLSLDDSMRRLELVNSRHAKVLELRLFGGLTVSETAETLGVSKRSIDTDWALAKAWLRADLASSA